MPLGASAHRRRPHADLDVIDTALDCVTTDRALVLTEGVYSMGGDVALSASSSRLPTAMVLWLSSTMLMGLVRSGLLAAARPKNSRHHNDPTSCWEQQAKLSESRVVSHASTRLWLP